MKRLLFILLLAVTVYPWEHCPYFIWLYKTVNVNQVTTVCTAAGIPLKVVNFYFGVSDTVTVNNKLLKSTWGPRTIIDDYTMYEVDDSIMVLYGDKLDSIDALFNQVVIRDADSNTRFLSEHEVFVP